MTLPDGREVYFSPNTPRQWPDFQTEMPWEEDVDEQGMANNAPLISLVDNTEMIDTLLAEWNEEQGGGGGGGVEGGADAGMEDGLGAGGCVQSFSHFCFS